MEREIVIYEPNTGRIDRCTSCSESMIAAQLRTGESWIYGTADDVTQCVDITQNTHVVVDKTLIDYELAGTVMSGLPVCTATVLNQTVSVSDGILNINIDVPGLYDVLLRSPVHLDTTVSVAVQ